MATSVEFQLYNLFPSLTSYQNSCNYEVVHLDNMKVTYVPLSNCNSYSSFSGCTFSWQYGVLFWAGKQTWLTYRELTYDHHTFLKQHKKNIVYIKMKINTCLINYLFVIVINFKIWNVNIVKYVISVFLDTVHSKQTYQVNCQVPSVAFSRAESWPTHHSKTAVFMGLSQLRQYYNPFWFQITHYQTMNNSLKTKIL